jgi:hypothetical protein
MTLLIAAVLMAAAVGVAVIHPILSRRVALVRDVTAGSVLDAEARKRVALTELKEIEYDYLGGKLDEADYRDLRERISREALAAMRAVDAVHGVAADGAPAEPVAAVAAADGVQGDGEVVDVAHACGWGNLAGSRFCGGCGERLA